MVCNGELLSKMGFNLEAFCKIYMCGVTMILLPGGGLSRMQQQPLDLGERGETLLPVPCKVGTLKELVMERLEIP